MPRMELEGGALVYDVRGEGPPILFISGLGGLGTYWRAQVQAFSQVSTTVTFDHRGIGASAGAPPYSVAQWADDALRLLDRLRIACTDVVGHSTGALIAQAIAARAPDRVGAMVLGGAWARPDARFRLVFELRKQALFGLGFDAYRKLSRLLSAPLNWQNAERVPDASAPADGFAEIVAARIDVLLGHDATETARSLQVPVLVLAAEDDVLIPSALSQSLAEMIPNARLKTFAHGGHHFPQTMTDTYNEAVADFLARFGAAKAEAGVS